MNSLRLIVSVVMVVLLGPVAGRAAGLAFESADDLKGLTITGEAVIDAAQKHGGTGALLVKPGSKVVWPLRDQDGSGTVEMWVYEDGAKPTQPKTSGAGALWGLVQADGRELMAGAIYAKYLAGDATYAVGSSLVNESQKPWQNVQYLGNAAKRTVGWHKWTFAFDPKAGLRILVDDKDVNTNPDRPNFIWNKTSLNGFTGIVLEGDTTDAGQMLWVDDVTVTLGPVAEVKTRWPPPPPPPPADLTVLPQQAPWNPTPFAKWKNGPGADENYIPIAVWLQDPALAPRYQAAGINLFIGLWKGPTQAQMDALRVAGMPVVCEMNDYAKAHLDEKLFVGWLLPDEPDNAQPFATYWKGDKEKIKEGWPEIYESRRLATSDYKGFGPPVPPKWLEEEYKHVAATDPSRPVFLGLGVGVAYEKYIGRGERTGRLDDYPDYIKCADIVGYDIYPAADDRLDVKDALWYVPRGVRRLREWTQDTKPVWADIETCVISTPSSKPTPVQTKADVWMALIHGARFVQYFVHQFKPKMNTHALLDDPEMLAGVTALNQQITRLAPVLNSPTIDDAVSVASTNVNCPVHAIVKRKDGATYVFAAAMHKEPTKATFTVKGVSDGVAEVIDENRTLPVKDGVFIDTFEANAVHLYRIAPASKKD